MVYFQFQVRPGSLNRGPSSSLLLLLQTPSVSQQVSHSSPVQSCPTGSPSCMCAGHVPRLLLFFPLMARQVHPCWQRNLQQLGVRLSRARDFCWGSPRPDGKMHVGALEFQFQAWLAGWLCLGQSPFLSLGMAKEGHHTVRVCNPAAQTTNWKVRPRAVTVRAPRLQTDGRINQTSKIIHPSRHADADAGADAEVR